MQCADILQALQQRVRTSMPRHAGALHPRREINKKLAMAIGT